MTNIDRRIVIRESRETAVHTFETRLKGTVMLVDTVDIQQYPSTQG